jgi:hypothetical protein
MKWTFAALLFVFPFATYAQNCTISKTAYDAALASLKSAVTCVAAPTPTPTPSPTPAPQPAWTKCADEGGRCNFTGTRQVRYGTTDKWAYKVALGSIGCTNDIFGDPAYGIAKSCYFSSQTTIIPAPTPTATPVVVTPNPTPAPPSSGGGSGIFIGSMEYGSLADVAAAVKDGETIKITKSIDNQSAAFNGPINVNVECAAGVKITYSAGTSQRPAWGKGIFVLSGVKSFNMKGCDVSGMLLHKDLGGNGAAVRIDDNVESVTLDGVYFHGNNNGILGGAKKITIKNSKFDRNGISSGAYDNVHNIYISAYTDLLDISDSYFGRVTPAHTLKSRAKATTITRTTFEQVAEFDGSYLADFSNGGNVLIQYSVFVKGPGQSQRSVLAYGMEGLTGDGRVNKMEAHHNIFVSDMNANFIAGSGEFNFHDNTMVGEFSGTIPQSNTKVFANRTEAGLSPAPNLPQVPSAGIMGFFRGLLK